MKIDKEAVSVIAANTLSVLNYLPVYHFNHLDDLSGFVFDVDEHTADFITIGDPKTFSAPKPRTIRYVAGEDIESRVEIVSLLKIDFLEEHERVDFFVFAGEIIPGYRPLLGAGENYYQITKISFDRKVSDNPIVYARRELERLRDHADKITSSRASWIHWM